MKKHQTNKDPSLMLYNNISKLVQAGIDFLSAAEIKEDSAVEKLQFLINKGLSNTDILQVLEVYNLKQENLADVISGVDEHYLDILREASKSSHVPEQQVYQSLPNIPPPLPEKDWKDVFVMTAATSGVVYSMYNLMQEFIIPKIMPKSQNDLDKDKTELQNNLDQITEKIKVIDDKYNEDTAKENLRVKQLNELVQKLNNKIDDLETEKLRIRQDFSKLKSDIKTMSLKFDEFINKQDSSNAIADLQKEICNINSSLGKNQVESYLKTDEKFSLPSSQQSLGMNTFHHKPMFENQLSFQNIPNTSDILSKMNLKPISKEAGNMETSSTKKLNSEELRDQIENITMDYSP